MILYFYLITAIYTTLVIWLIKGWNRALKQYLMPHSVEFNPKCSVVVAVRNEEHNINALLDGLTRQDYPSENFEIIVVDDHSEDETAALVRTYAQKSEISITLLSSPGAVIDRSPKKTALNAGIKAAKGNLIALTDADCLVGPSWLSNLIGAFRNDSVKFVSGPVGIEGNNGLLEGFQTVEFCSVMGSGAAMLQYGIPLMCNGANVAFRKSAFEQVTGYEGIDDRASGDDVLLMQKIFKAYEHSVVFLPITDALVLTPPVTSLHDFITQRIRWASKWNTASVLYSWVLPVFIFIYHLSLIFGVLYFAPSPGILQFGMLVCLKWAVDYIFIQKVAKFCRIRLSTWLYLLSAILYPFYVVWIGAAVHTGSWNWKGRTFNR